MRKVRLSLTTFGVILGIAGIEHGIGEIQQGSKIVGAHFFESWPDNKLYEILAGEPAFTLFTGLTFTTLGILAVIVSIMIILCSLFFIDKKYGSLMFLILDILMFILGAGFAGPIIIGIPIVIFATVFRGKSNVSSASELYKKFIRSSFSFFYVIAIISWSMMWPGFVLISYLYNFPSGGELLIYVVGGISMISFFATVLFGILFDRIDWKKAVSSFDSINDVV